MPNLDGRLSQAEKDRIQKWLVEKASVMICPACGYGEWNVGDYLATVPTFNGIELRGLGYPAAIIICGQCAFLRFHSAVLIGLVGGGEGHGAKTP